MNKTALFADIDSAAARQQAFQHLPMIDHPTSDVRQQLKDAEIAILEATMRRDMLRLIVEMRDAQDLRRTRSILEKICA
jgi:hypothetical protein